MEQKKKSLLEKYNIPLYHLDFEYVKKCESAREMEKILMILRSGEEGFYPDLTRCAEEKLKELKPDSKLFRYEEPVQKSDILDKKELKPILDWTHDIKSKDNELNDLKQNMRSLAANLAPMRKPSKIETDKQVAESEIKTTKPNQPVAANKPAKPSEHRIKSTDYGKWDKYDPDVEMLRMDLNEERAKEQAEQLNQKYVTPIKKKTKDTEESAEQLKERLMSKLDQLSKLERDHLADKHRLRGNEYFKTKEYESAIEEYSQAIIYDPENASRSYNNRAISHLKLKHYMAAISDCEACLEMEPDNLKALLRLADANYGYGRRRESYDVYQRVLKLDANNATALKSLEQLHAQLGEIAPAHATRMVIEELPPDPKTNEKVIPKATKKLVTPKETPIKEYDLAELVKPNRVIKNKILNAAEALGGKDCAKHQDHTKQLTNMEESPTMLRMPLANKRNDTNKVLIEEL